MYNITLTKVSAQLGPVACWATLYAASVPNNAHSHINLASSQFCSTDPLYGTRRVELESSNTSNAWNASILSPWDGLLAPSSLHHSSLLCLLPPSPPLTFDTSAPPCLQRSTLS
ncbi:hypothetical protein AX14_009082 [Amanita brunnescens Koide BX004]|nr:hypothetical protein AX14_009082 [Amanita brunnescens Koide BX004]